MRARSSFLLMLVVVLAGFGTGLTIYSRSRTPNKRDDSAREVFGGEREVFSELRSGFGATSFIDNASTGVAPMAEEDESNLVRIGVCEDTLVDEEARAVARELARLFHADGKQVTQVVTKNGLVPEGHKVPDIIMCLGYFYPKQLVAARENLLTNASDLPKKFRNRLVNNVYYAHGYKAIRHKKGRPFLVAFSGEPWDQGNCKRYDLMFVTRDDYNFDGCALGYFPVLSTTFAKRAQLTDHNLVIDDLDVDKEVTPALAKREFMALVVSSCYKPQYTGMDALLRAAFFDFVSSEYKPVHGLGGCRRTPGLPLLPDFVRQGPKIDSVTERYKQYKFVITFENERHPGYVSEKILNAMLSNSIPVYWGAENLEKLLNPKRFIHCNIDSSQFKESQLNKEWAASGRRSPDQFIEPFIKYLHANFSACLDEIKRLDQDDKAYLSMLRQPILINNRVEGSIFDRRIQAKQVYEALRMQKSYLVAEK